MISINFYEIAFQCVNFLILMWLLKKYLTAPLANFLENRTQSIKHNIEQAEANKQEANRLLVEQKELIKKSHQDAQVVRQNAEESAAKEREIAMKASQDEAQKIIDAARKDIENEVIQAKQSLKNDVAELTLTISQKVIEKSIDPEDNRVIVESYLKSDG